VLQSLIGSTSGRCRVTATTRHGTDSGERRMRTTSSLLVEEGNDAST